jgi:hypothetical protein
MSVLAAVRGWRVSFVNASTKRIRWSHRIEHISRPSGLFLLRGNPTSKIQAGTSEQLTPVGEAKLQQPHGFTRTEQNDLPVLATAGPDQSTKSLTAEEKEVVAEMRRGDYSRLRIAQFLGCDLRVVHDASYQLGPIDSRWSKLPRFRLSDSELKRAEALRREGMTWKAIQVPRHRIYHPERTIHTPNDSIGEAGACYQDPKTHTLFYRSARNCRTASSRKILAANCQVEAQIV